MAQTSIPIGHPLAKKVFGAAVFFEVTQKPSFTGRLTGPAPTMASASSKLGKMQTSPEYPIIRVMDLRKQKGHIVSVDMFNILEGLPVTGDRKLSGRMMKLSSSSMDIRIDQMRGGVDTGGRMTQQRTVHDLRTVGRAGLSGWYTRLRDQIVMTHLAGARGSQVTTDWVLPLEDHPEFQDIVVNDIQAPTYGRHFYAGDAEDVSDLDATDILRLEDIDRVRAVIDEQDVPLQPIRFPDDPAADEDPLYVMLVSPRQWHYLINRSGAAALRTFQQHARERGSSNPLFKGNVGLWNGILVKKMQRCIRFNQGDVVKTATNAAHFTTEDKTIGGTQFGTDDYVGQHAVDRSIILGAQSLAEVYGSGPGGGAMSWHEEVTDHDNTLEASISSMGGFSKLRFRNKAGRDFDHGVMVLDSYAPDPRTVVVANP